MTSNPPINTDTNVWEGRPSPLAQLPSYVALLVGAIVATAGILFLARASGTGGGADGGTRSLETVAPWLVVLAWLGCGAAALAVFLKSRSTRYVLTSERLRVITGLLSTTTQEIELRRVRDTIVVQPFFLRLVGLGHVTLMSADSSTPRATIRAVPDPATLQSKIRSFVQESYRRGGVREIDVL